MMVIINSSKTMRTIAESQRPNAADLTLPDFLDDADRLVAQLRCLSADDISSLMKTSDRLTAQTIRQLANWRKSAHRREGQPALMTFSGDVYAPIRADEMTVTDLYGVRTYAEELYTGFNLGDDLRTAWLSALPGSLNSPLKPTVLEPA